MSKCIKCGKETNMPFHTCATLPDKTLEEAIDWLKRVTVDAQDQRVHQAVSLVASATAAQQREVENIQKAGDALADIVESLSKQLRTEREKYKELFMKAQDLVEELKRVTTTN